jgi:heme A synthase
LAEGLASDVSSAAHLFVRLRLLHPFIATGTALFVLGAAAGARWLRPSPRVRLTSRVVTALFVTQYGVGLLNVTLLAPIPMQLVHLVFADLVWIALVLLSASALAADHPIISKNGPAPMSDVPPSTSNVAPVT